MTFSVVIPARYASQRLPGKPLANIAGKPMIERVFECAKKSAAKDVIVATDDQRIFDAVSSFGGKVCMTRDDHESGTDRLQEVAQIFGMQDDDIIVNVQGDEPQIPAEVINQVAENLQSASAASAATLCETIENVNTVFDPNAVKVVMDINGKALYFSRASIPWARQEFSNKPPTMPVLNLAMRHIGIYAYRVALLNQFVQWPMSPIESVERLEQLRILYNGHSIHVEEACKTVPGGVDTQEDLDRINQLFSGS